MMTNTMNTRDPIPARIDGDTPNLRLFALLEAIAQKNEPFTLQTMVEETGLPKPTMHRMLQQLEGAGILQREGNGRHYGTGRRLMRLADSVLLNNTTHGARHAVLAQLVRDIGESCNITAFSGSEVLYLDRVERSEEHTSELQSPCNLVCRLLLEKKKNNAVTLSTHSN